MKYFNLLLFSVLLACGTGVASKSIAIYFDISYSHDLEHLQLLFYYIGAWAGLLAMLVFMLALIHHLEEGTTSFWKSLYTVNFTLAAAGFLIVGV